MAWNKGNTVCYLLDNLGLHNNTTASYIYIGDDLTDEDTFKVTLLNNIHHDTIF